MCQKYYISEIRTLVTVFCGIFQQFQGLVTYGFVVSIWQQKISCSSGLEFKKCFIQHAKKRHTPKMHIHYKLHSDSCLSFSDHAKIEPTRLFFKVEWNIEWKLFEPTCFVQLFCAVFYSPSTEHPRRYICDGSCLRHQTNKDCEHMLGYQIAWIPGCLDTKLLGYQVA